MPKNGELDPVQLQEGKKVSLLVEQFKTKLNGQFKSSEENMPLDSVVWYIESTLNYQYGRSEYSDEYQIHSVKFPINEIGGNFISISEAVNLYNNILKEISDTYYEGDYNSKSFSFADIDLQTNSAGGKEIVAEYKINTIKNMKSTYGYPVTPSIGFGETDYWYPNFKMGKCGIYEGQGIGHDATTILTSTCSHMYIPRYYETTTHRPVWVDIDGKGMLREIKVGDEWTNLWPKDGYYTSCIGPEEMNWYYLKVVSALLKDNIPQGFKCNYIYIYDEVIPGGISREVVHFLELKYGNIVWVKHEWTVLPKL